MFEIVKKAIDEFNPLGLLPEAPNDEFDNESRNIAGQISMNSNVEEIADIISNVLSKAFDEKFEINKCMATAEKKYKSMKPWISVSVEFFSADKGGRKANIYLNGGYRPHFRVIGDTEYLGVQFIEAPNRIISPNEMVTARVCLLYHPDVSYSKLCEGKDFDILEGARVVGRGRVISPVVAIDE